MIRGRQVYNAEATQSSCKCVRRCLFNLFLKVLRLSNWGKIKGARVVPCFDLNSTVEKSTIAYERVRWPIIQSI